jgi:hypothetical protein
MCGAARGMRIDPMPIGNSPHRVRKIDGHSHGSPMSAAGAQFP